MAPALLILDNSCLARLESAAALERFRANARVADWVAQLTELNLVEAVSTKPDSVQARLLATMRNVANNEPMLPWVFRLLKVIGRGIVDHKTSISVGASGKEWYLDDLEAARGLRDEVDAFRLTIETRYSQLHERNRQRMQRGMKESGLTDDFESTQDFLDREWATSETRRVFARATWDALGLPGGAPMDLLDRNEAWRLLLDGEGVAMYERSIAKRQPSRVHRFDLLQLIYLAGALRRIIATADSGFLRAADAVLRGRYPNARVVHIDDLLS